MDNMDEENIQASLTAYRAQLEQVEGVIEASGEAAGADLLQLRQDLQQLIQLTEETLLGLKKSKLLSMLDTGPSVSSTGPSTSTANGHTTHGQDDMDAEFAAFQAAIGEEDNQNPEHSASTPSPSPRTSPSPASNDQGPSHTPDSDSPALGGGLTEDISGVQCRAPYSHDYGHTSYYNAMILAVEDMQQATVRVVFTEPQHRSMMTCPYFLQDKCRFSDEDCRYCHGHVVPVTELQEYKDPDYSLLVLESPCLAQDTDGLWYPGTVAEVSQDRMSYKVMFDANHHVIDVTCEAIRPSDKEDPTETDSDSDPETPSNDQVAVSSDEDDDDLMPVYLWRPGQTTDKLGEWETHTRGIGSKLMAAMGYITGQGLGRSGAGRAEPVPIQLLPQGKSLDKIMELKAIAGDRDLYDVLKQQKRKHRRAQDKAAKAYVKGTTDDQTKPADVFDFINKKLHGHKGDLKGLVKPTQKHKPDAKASHISEKDLRGKTDRHLNVQLVKTSEEIRSVEKEVSRLRDAVSRHEKAKDKRMVQQYKTKLNNMETYLSQLQSSQNTLEKHKHTRKEHKKLTVF